MREGWEARSEGLKDDSWSKLLLIKGSETRWELFRESREELDADGLASWCIFEDEADWVVRWFKLFANEVFWFLEPLFDWPLLAVLEFNDFSDSKERFDLASKGSISFFELDLTFDSVAFLLSFKFWLQVRLLGVIPTFSPLNTDSITVRL